MMTPPSVSRFVSGSLEDGQLVLTRDNGTTTRCRVVIHMGTLTDNSDSTYTLTFPE